MRVVLYNPLDSLSIYLDSLTFGIDNANGTNDNSHVSFQTSCDAAGLKIVFEVNFLIVFMILCKSEAETTFIWIY